MQLTSFDLAIIGLYLATTVAIGLMLKRRAAKNLDSYLLGGKQLPWYMLSRSNSTITGLYNTGVNPLLGWLASGLRGGDTRANQRKRYGCRLRGWGYFWGMILGLICALAFRPIIGMLLPSIAADILPLYLFPVVILISGIACIVGSLYSPPEDEELLKRFYRNVRPWGFWGPVLEKVQKDDPEFTANPHFKRDMFNIILGTCLQTALVALPIFIVIKMPTNIFIAASVIAVTILILRKTWYANIANWPAEEIAREKALQQGAAK